MQSGRLDIQVNYGDAQPSSCQHDSGMCKGERTTGTAPKSVKCDYSRASERIGRLTYARLAGCRRLLDHIKEGRTRKHGI